MSYEKVVAVYDTEGSANAAVKTLTSAGYPADDISLIRNDREADKAGLHEPGVWQRLFGGDIEHHEAAVYGQSLKEGSVIVSVRVPETEAPKVISLLDSHKPVDILDRAKALGLEGAAAAVPGIPTASKLTAVAAAVPRIPTASRLTGEEIVRLAEEQLNVGKRTVEAGFTRVRRYIVEKPVDANVTLHEEHVEVLRRAISDPTYLKNIDWSDRTIEVRETAEEAVVDKTAHITEEVVIRKKGSDHVETVHDKVRSQQIDVERVPVGMGSGKNSA